MATPSPTKESVGSTSEAKAVGVPSFTEKEDRILKLAWLCLKSGPPEVDLDKLTWLGEFRSKKTASNTWGVIKNKLKALKPADDGESEVTAVVSPQKPEHVTNTTPKKRGKNAEENESQGILDANVDGGSPIKKSRKKPIKRDDDEAVTAGGDEQVVASTNETGLIFIHYEGGNPEEVETRLESHGNSEDSNGKQV